MIGLNRYSEGFQQDYWETVEKKLFPSKKEKEAEQKLILDSCRKFLPNDFFDSETPSLKELVLAPFKKLKEAKSYIEHTSKEQMRKECFDPRSKNKSQINDLYFKIYEAFDKVADSQKNKTSMRVRMVAAADITVCPYCNRDYINCRAETVAGAQLDHFFSRSEYPVFAVCLYNLVPVCANCNRVKSAKSTEFASPFDETIDWDKEITFTYKLDGLNVAEIDIEIEPDNKAIENNIAAMRIKAAYQLHTLEIMELREKKKAYSDSQIEEIRDVLHCLNISDEEIKRIVFGKEIMPEDMRKKPLGKLLRDIHKELEIY